MDEEYEVILRKALDVGDLPPDFDPNKVPQTGEEYLHYVMYEKSQCQEFIRADINDKKIKKDKILEIEIQKGCESAPKDFLPSSNWQNQQVAQFSSFRLHLEKIKYSIPNRVSNFHGSEDICRGKCSSEPTFSELVSYNQNAIAKLLEYHLDWLDDVEIGFGISRVMCVWLYALLACLEVPLKPQMCFVLRELARKCSKIRCNLIKTAVKEIYVPLNLFICLVSRYFNQNDLADD